MNLERHCDAAAHWSESQYQEVFYPEASPARIALIAVQEGNAEVLGFLVASHHPPDWELENIAVASESRGKDIGTQLLQALLTRAQQTNSESVFLEVRESNAAARALYEKLVFRQTGRRKSYYANPIEDAILYSKSLGSAPTVP